MTTVITRVFQDASAAKSAAERILFKGLPTRAVQIITGDDAERLSAQMQKAQVHETAVKAYVESVTAGHALLVVRATYKPLGAARIAREILAKRETIDVGAVEDDFFVPDGPDKAKSVLKDHPRFLTQNLSKHPGGLISRGFGLPMLSARKSRASAKGHHRRGSRAFWPMPLLSTKERAIKVKRGGGYMSRAFWPMPLLSTKERRKSVIEGGGAVFSRTLTWPTS